MSRVIFIVLMMSSSFIMAWETYLCDIKLCGEDADFQVVSSSFGVWSGAKIEQIVQSSANYWNEAGSEHHLYYDGVGSTNPEIFFDYLAWSGVDVAAETTYVTTTLLCGGCIEESTALIEVNTNFWNNNSWGTYMLRNVITHEFGHLLGLAHTGETYNIYRGILMQNEAIYNTRITEDDKYGVRYLYGKDDQKMMTGISTGGSPNYSGSSWDTVSPNYNYETYSQPQLVYQPNNNQNYDYLAVWVKADTREVNYQFVKDSSTNNEKLELVGNRLVLYSGSFHSKTLTAPSVAINSSGSTAVVVWKQEEANYSASNADNIYIARINMNTDTSQIQSFTKTTEPYKGKTMSKPIVKWSNAWGGRFIIFCSDAGEKNIPTVDNNVWNLNYVVSSADYIFHNSNIQDKYVKVDWNPMGITCNLPNNNCMILYNDPSMYSRLIETGKQKMMLLEPAGTTTSPYLTTVSSSSNYTSLKNAISNNLPKNYGHYSVNSRISGTQWYYNDGWEGVDEYTIAFTFMPKAAKQVLNIASFKMWYYQGWHYSNLDNNIYGSISSTGARTGHSIVWNARKNFYRYFWIKE